MFNEGSYKQEISLMYPSGEVLLHKSKFVKERECVLFSSCFMFYLPLWRLVNISVIKASIDNGKYSRVWHDSEERKGRTQPIPSGFAAIIFGAGSGKRQRYQLTNTKAKEERKGRLQ